MTTRVINRICFWKKFNKQRSRNFNSLFLYLKKSYSFYFDNLSTRPLQFIVGSGCSGKSYVLVDIACRIKNRDVFFFETKDRLTDQAFQDLTCKKTV